MSSTPGASRQRAWITTAEVCDWLGISRETPVAPGERGGDDHRLEPSKHQAVKEWELDS